MDSDSSLIVVNKHASMFMSDNTNHYIRPLWPIKNCIVKVYGLMVGFGGYNTIKWNIEDDNGKVNYIIIHNVNYIPEPPSS